MNVYEILFSPTGGTKKAADIVAAAFGDAPSVIDLTDHSQPFHRLELSGGDLAVIAVPSYGGRVPALAAERLSRLRGEGAQAILLCAYGARAFEDTLAELRDVAVKSGFRVIAALAAVTEHSVVRTIAAGRPDARDRALLQSFALDIHRKLSAGELSEPAIPGNRPYKDGLKRPMIPEAGPGCTGCGACAKACPAQAIDREDPKKTNPEACASCMRCVLVCPSRARKLPEAVYASSKAMLEKACEGHKDCQLFL